MKLIALAALACGMMQAEEKTLCGTENKHTAPGIELVQVACIDYDALKKFMPIAATGKETKVLIHASKGHPGGFAYVTLDGLNWRKAVLALDSRGRLSAIVAFPGTGYTSIEVDIP